MKQKNKLQEKYDKLSLVERNAYEQIVDRHRISFITFPYTFIRIAIELGILFIVTSLILGIPLTIFTEAYEAYLRLMFYGMIISIGLIFLSPILNLIRLNKLKRKLLND